jgi:hypothetical protein
LDKLVHYAKNGTPTQVKNATVILAKGEQYQLLQEILDEVVYSLSTDDYERLVRQFSFLKPMAFYANHIYAKHDTEIIAFIINNVLMKNTTLAKDEDQDWTPYENLENEGKAKVLGLKILLKPLLILEDDSSAKVTFATSLMKLFRTLLVSDGELLQDQTTPYNLLI